MYCTSTSPCTVSLDTVHPHPLLDTPESEPWLLHHWFRRLFPAWYCFSFFQLCDLHSVPLHLAEDATKTVPAVPAVPAFTALPVAKPENMMTFPLPGIVNGCQHYIRHLIWAVRLCYLPWLPRQRQESINIDLQGTQRTNLAHCLHTLVDSYLIAAESPFPETWSSAEMTITGCLPFLIILVLSFCML